MGLLYGVPTCSPCRHLGNEAGHSSFFFTLFHLFSSTLPVSTSVCLLVSQRNKNFKKTAKKSLFLQTYKYPIIWLSSADFFKSMYIVQYGVHIVSNIKCDLEGCGGLFPFFSFDHISCLKEIFYFLSVS